MSKYILKLFLFVGVALAAFSCKDNDGFNENIRDVRPAVPVTFPNATTYGGNPFIVIDTNATSTITFTLEIPASSGRTIREISRVAAGATGINAGTLSNPANNYIAAPISANGTTATFTTTLGEFRKKRNTVPTGPPDAGTVYREIAFLFLVTLDDGTEIVTQQVRVRIVPSI